MTTQTQTHIVLRANNDANGNPRRVSLLIENGEVIEARDHGYRGAPRDIDGWPPAACQIDVQAGEYRAWLDIPTAFRPPSTIAK
jgi:hypothetical protein